MPRNAIGLAYPIARGTDGYFAVNRDSVSQVRANIINVLSTARGERPMRPAFGTRLHDILYAGLSGDVESRIEEEVRAALGRWLPYVSIREVAVRVDGGGARIGISFTTAMTGDEAQNMIIWAEASEQA